MTSKNPKNEILAQVPSDVALFLEQMREMGQKRNIPNISWNTAGFMIEKLRPRNISRILEIWPANGFSTMMLSLACPKAEITSIECSRHAFEELRHNIQIFSFMKNQEWKMKNDGTYLSPADFPPKITSDINQEKINQFSLYYGDAREILPAFVSGADIVTCSSPMSILHDLPKERFDFIFIDGAFRMTREFFDLSRPLLGDNGIIIIDDAIKYRWKMGEFHEYLEERGILYDLVQTDEDDGVMLIDFWNTNIQISNA
jgi:predicted O-methyltransferase YrrM